MNLSKSAKLRNYDVVMIYARWGVQSLENSKEKLQNTIDDVRIIFYVLSNSYPKMILHHARSCNLQSF